MLKADSPWYHSAKESVSLAFLPHAWFVSSLRNSCWVHFYIEMALVLQTVQCMWHWKLKTDWTPTPYNNSLLCFKFRVESKVTAIVADVSDPFPFKIFLSPLPCLCWLVGYVLMHESKFSLIIWSSVVCGTYSISLYECFFFLLAAFVGYSSIRAIICI